MQPIVLIEQEVADRLRVKPCTVANERKRGRLGYTMVGARIFYTPEHVNQYLKNQEVSPCVSSDSDPAKSGITGRAKSRDAKVIPIRGASRGTTVMPDRHVAKALALRTFQKRV